MDLAVDGPAGDEGAESAEGQFVDEVVYDAGVVAFGNEGVGVFPFFVGAAGLYVGEGAGRVVAGDEGAPVKGQAEPFYLVGYFGADFHGYGVGVCDVEVEAGRGDFDQVVGVLVEGKYFGQGGGQGLFKMEGRHGFMLWGGIGLATFFYGREGSEMGHEAEGGKL